MSTPERQQDPGEHGYGGVEQDQWDADDTPEQGEHPLEDPDNDPEQHRQNADDGDQEDV